MYKLTKIKSRCPTIIISRATGISQQPDKVSGKEVEFDSNGKFLNVSIQGKERVWGGGTMGSVAGMGTQASIGSPVLVDPLLPILLTDALTTTFGNPRSEEINRVKTFLESRSLTFSEKQWKSQRFIYNLWVKNEKDNK